MVKQAKQTSTRSTSVGKKKPSVMMKQHILAGAGCIGTKTDGTPCPNMRGEAHLPYCKRCLASGDPSLKVVKHPKFGKCLIATRDLKKGYMMAWWGNRVSRKKLPFKSWEWALESPKGMIDAVPFRKGSVVQFAQCPGPSERPTVDFSRNYDAMLTAKSKTCLLFKTLCDIPKNHQVTMMYNKDEKTTNEFFAERGLVRADIGCPAFPALKKKAKGRQ